MKSFEYVEARGLEEAVARGQSPARRFMPGGTNRVALLRLDVERPDTLVDLARVPSSDGVWDERGLTLGAPARHSERSSLRERGGGIHEPLALVLHGVAP